MINKLIPNLSLVHCHYSTEPLTGKVLNQTSCGPISFFSSLRVLFLNAKKFVCRPGGLTEIRHQRRSTHACCSFPAHYLFTHGRVLVWAFRGS